MVYLARTPLPGTVRVGWLGMLANVLQRFLTKVHCADLVSGSIGGVLASCEVLTCCWT